MIYVCLLTTKGVASQKKSTRHDAQPQVETKSSPYKNLSDDIKKAIDGVKAARGNSNSGGSLALANQLMQQYRRLPHQIPAYQMGFDPAMKKLSKKMPALGKFLDERLHQLSLYVIPIEFESLASELTGLPFLAQHPAMQSPSNNYQDGAEVYISEASLIKSIEMQTHLLVNEVIESIFMTEKTTPGIRTATMKAVKDFSYWILNHDNITASELKSKLIRAASIGSSEEPKVFGKYQPALGGPFGICDFRQARIERAQTVLLEELEKTGFLSEASKKEFQTLEPCKFVPLLDKTKNEKSYSSPSIARDFDSYSLSRIKLFETIEESAAREIEEQKFNAAKIQVASKVSEQESNLHRQALQLMQSIQFEFESNIGIYSSIVQNLFESLSNVCLVTNVPQPFDRNSQTFLPYTAEQKNRFMKELEPRLSKFAEQILIEYYRTSYMNSNELKKRGLRTEVLGNSFYNSLLLQELLLDDLRLNGLEYYLTPEKWNGEARTKVVRNNFHEPSGGFNIFYSFGGAFSNGFYRGHGSLALTRVWVESGGGFYHTTYGIDFLDLRQENRNFEYYFKVAQQINYDYCERLPRIKSFLEKQIRGEFEGGLAKRFELFVPKHLRLAAKHVENQVIKKEIRQ